MRENKCFVNHCTPKTLVITHHQLAWVAEKTPDQLVSEIKAMLIYRQEPTAPRSFRELLGKNGMTYRLNPDGSINTIWLDRQSVQRILMVFDQMDRRTGTHRLLPCVDFLFSGMLPKVAA